MVKIGLQLWRSFVRFLYPSYCADCRIFLPQDGLLCAECQQRVQLVLTQELHLKQGKKAAVYAAARYEGAVQRLVRAKNHYNSTAAWQLGLYVARQAHCPWSRFDALIPVPLHWRRRWARGFNQAEMIARAISQEHSVPVISPVLRKRSTLFQAKTLNRAARQANIHDAFSFCSVELQGACRGKSLLIVDDLVTSGATVSAIAELLYSAGARSVAVVVAARA